MLIVEDVTRDVRTPYNINPGQKWIATSPNFKLTQSVNITLDRRRRFIFGAVDA